MTTVGIAADHEGFELKRSLARSLREEGYEVIDFGAETFAPGDDYPDFVLPLARAVSRRLVDRGIAISGSGVGAVIAANKVRGARAALCSDDWAARKGVEDDDMNVLCLGARVVGHAVAWDLIQTFLDARFADVESHRRRLAKVSGAEEQPAPALVAPVGGARRTDTRV